MVLINMHTLNSLCINLKSISSNLSSACLLLHACHPAPVSFHPPSFLRPRAMALSKLWSPDEGTVNDMTKHTMNIQIMLEDSGAKEVMTQFLYQILIQQY